MLSGVMIGFLVGISAATWAYTWTMRRTGNNTQSALITGGVAGLFSFVFIVTVVAIVDSYLGT